MLLRWASELREVDVELTARVTPAAIESIVALIPEAWLAEDPYFADVDAHRRAYVDYLVRRLEEPRNWLEEAVRARDARV